MTEKQHNPDYIHHHQSRIADSIREVVFGIEDGMVSTMGAITGIAAGTGNPSIVVLSGFVIIAVESISMGVGSYVSNKSQKEINKRMLIEEKEEIENDIDLEREEMVELFIEDGWPKEFATKMADHAATDKDLMLKEMAYRELKVFADQDENPVQDGFIMWISYIIGGSVPLAPYLIWDMYTAIPISISITLIGLFALGVFTTKYSKRSWWKAGLEMLLMAGAAAAAGYFVGTTGEKFIERL